MAGTAPARPPLVTPTSQMYACPAEDESRSPIDTPTVARSASSIATAPASDAPPADASSARRAGTWPPNATIPVAAAPINNDRPA